MSLLAQHIFHIFPCNLVTTKDYHAEIYQMLLANLEKVLSLLTTDLH